MRTQFRLLRTSAFLAAAAMAGVSSGAGAQSRWSDPATWPDGQVPAAGDAVEIARDMDVVLDTDAPGLRSLTIRGRLTFSDQQDIGLETEWIHVAGGSLTIGTADNPHASRATITLTDNVTGEDVNGMGDRGIMLMGGTLNLHGTSENTWTKLAATAERGATEVQLLDASGWAVGDEIVLASTDYNPRQAERRTITGISGNTVSFAEPLAYMHFGEITFGVDERGEVANLTRNIVIQATEDADETYFGGHVMAMAGSRMHVDGVEFARMGQHLTLARYPVHFHVLGEGAGQYVRNASIHDTYNRCVTVHGTNNLLIENNVTYNTVGHCFFMEDGIETGNAFIRNVAIQTKCHPTLDCVPTDLGANGERAARQADGAAYREASFHGGNTLLPSDNTAASFWITNPDNSYIDNVAAGSDSTGFWLSIPQHPNGAFLGTQISADTWPRRTPLRAFRGNTAHSNFDGFLIDRHIDQDNTFGLASIPLLPLADPTDLESEVMETHFENLTAYKNRNGGLWGRGDMYVYRNLTLADNAVGMTQAAGDIGSLPFSSRLVDSLVVGETANVGNPETAEELAYGRSLPKPAIPDFPIRGYEYYDYRDDVVDTTFVNFQDNDQRRTGALSFLMFTSAGLSTGSTISGAQFVDAKPVWFPTYDARFDNDNRGGNAYRTLSFRDLDGSVTGVPDSQVLLHDGENDSVATDDSCQVHPDWNAAVCTGDIGRLNLSDSRGELPAAVDLESRTARFALLSSLGPNAPDTPLVRAQRAALFSRRPAQAPVALVRNGRTFRVSGDQTTVRAGSEIEVQNERPELTLSLAEMDAGSWVLFELPGFASASSGEQQASLDALRAATETSWYRGEDGLWVKLVLLRRSTRSSGLPTCKPALPPAAECHPAASLFLPLLLIRGQVFEQEIGHRAVEVPPAVGALADAVGAVGIGHHLEILVERHQPVDQLFGGLIVDVVVAGAVDDQEVAFQPCGMGDRRSLFEPFGVDLRRAHVAFLVDRVVQSLVRHVGDGDARVVKLGVAEHHVQRHRTAAAPSPDAHAIGVEVRAIGQHGAQPGGLVSRGHHADLPVDRLAPVAPARGRGAMVVHAGNDISLLRHQQVPHVGIAVGAPVVDHRLAGRLAIDVHQQRVALLRVEVRREHHPRVERHPVADIDGEEFDVALRRGGQVGAGAGIVDDHLPVGMVGQGDQRPGRRIVEARPGVDRPLRIGRHVVGMHGRRACGGQPFGTGVTRQRRAVEIAPGIVVGRGEVIGPATARIDADQLDHVFPGGRDRFGLAGLAVDAVEPPPAVALAEPGEMRAIVEPGQLFVDVDPGFVGFGEQRARLAGGDVHQHHLVAVLQPVHVLDDQLVRIVRPVHLRHVGIARIALQLHPHRVPADSRHHAHAHCRIGGAGLGILQRDGLRIGAVEVVHHVEGADAFGVELPVGDAARIRAPAEPVAQAEFLFVHPVAGAVDDKVRPVVRQLGGGTGGQVLDIDVVGKPVGNARAVGRELGIHQCACRAIGGDLAQVAAGKVEHPEIAQRLVAAEGLRIGLHQQVPPVGRPVVIVDMQRCAAVGRQLRRRHQHAGIAGGGIVADDVLPVLHGGRGVDRGVVPGTLDPLDRRGALPGEVAIGKDGIERERREAIAVLRRGRLSRHQQRGECEGRRPFRKIDQYHQCCSPTGPQAE